MYIYFKNNTRIHGEKRAFWFLLKKKKYFVNKPQKHKATVKKPTSQSPLVAEISNENKSIAITTTRRLG